MLIQLTFMRAASNEIGGGFRVDRELGFGVEANLGNAHFSLKGMWSVISKP
jgi:hypothetical protein